VIYECHVKGMTIRHPEIAPNLRGTYLGLSSDPMLDYFHALGVTAVELLPVHTFVTDQYLIDRGLRNYWGYNSIGFFAPDPTYSSNPARTLQEFKEMVARFHDAGLEVILDVVYNHTAEGNELGPTLCFKGIDNAAYYRLLPDQPRYYINDTGTGNTLNVSHARVMQMVTDSLRYWVTDMHVDGFRFDLGTILARETDGGFNRASGFLKCCSQDPVLGGVKLIAEPWDCGPGGYQVGAFPPGWSEWNDKFRDTVRGFWKGDVPVRDLAPRLCASPDEFRHRGRRPWASINFVTAHDGFTLHDLVSYNDKHNEANGEDNRDGTNNNRSWNCGAEGATDDPGVRALRARQMRNFLATILLSQGVPMIVAGDEFGRTQQGNNNAYCQDNEISWLDWNIGEDGNALQRVVSRLIAIRRTHPMLRNRWFLTGRIDRKRKVRDVDWISPAGTPMKPEDWARDDLHCLGMLLADTRLRRFTPDWSDARLLLIFNAHHESVPMTLPDSRVGPWSLQLDTGRDETPAVDVPGGATYDVPARTVLMFEAGSTGRAGPGSVDERR
jgi:glycogen operon protein